MATADYSTISKAAVFVDGAVESLNSSIESALNGVIAAANNNYTASLTVGESIPSWAQQWEVPEGASRVEYDGNIPQQDKADFISLVDENAAVPDVALNSRLKEANTEPYSAATAKKITVNDDVSGWFSNWFDTNAPVIDTQFYNDIINHGLPLDWYKKLEYNSAFLISLEDECKRIIESNYYYVTEAIQTLIESNVIINEGTIRSLVDTAFNRAASRRGFVVPQSMLDGASEELSVFYTHTLADKGFEIKAVRDDAYYKAQKNMLEASVKIEDIRATVLKEMGGIYWTAYDATVTKYVEDLKTMISLRESELKRQLAVLDANIKNAQNLVAVDGINLQAFMAATKISVEDQQNILRDISLDLTAQQAEIEKQLVEFDNDFPVEKLRQDYAKTFNDFETEKFFKQGEINDRWEKLKTAYVELDLKQNIIRIKAALAEMKGEAAVWATTYDGEIDALNAKVTMLKNEVLGWTSTINMIDTDIRSEGA